MAFTYFFRDLQTLELAVSHVVPYTTGRSRIRVWDAGCASGQEAYTLAMLFAESMGGFAFKNLLIHATDIDECDLLGQRDDRPGFFRIAENLKQRIFYAKHDLLTFEPIGQSFSMIVCKNVLLHFQPGERVEVIRMFHRSLAPGGYFATEQTQKMPAETTGLFEQVSPEARVFRAVGL